MLSSKIKDIKIRKSFCKIEKLKKIRKFIFTNLLGQSFLNHSTIYRQNLLLSLLKVKNKIIFKSKVRITNRCVINNRSRGVFRPFGISRVLMRNLMHFGVLPGYSKAVW